MSRVETDLNEQLPTEYGKPLPNARRIQGYSNLNESEFDSVVCLVTKILPESRYTMMPLKERKTMGLSYYKSRI